jgi:hypothetical protein
MSNSPRLHTLTALVARWLVVLSLFCALILTAQEMPVPVRYQYLILLKTLTFDRNLKARCGNGIVLGVLYQSRFRQSVNVKDELVTIANESSYEFLDAYRIRVVPIDLSSEAGLEEQISASGVNTLYVAPLRAIDLATISAVTQKNKVLTLTGVPEYVDIGLSIGVGIKGDRPTLVINQRASKAEGADLDSQLLKLARTIR